MSSISRKLCAVALSASLALSAVPAFALADEVAQPEDQVQETQTVDQTAFKRNLQILEAIYKKACTQIDKLTDLSNFAKAVYKNAIFEFARNDEMVAKFDRSMQMAIELQQKTAAELASDPEALAAESEVTRTLIKLLDLDKLVAGSAQTAQALAANGQALRESGENISLTDEKALIIAPIPGTYDGTAQKPAIVVCLYNDEALLAMVEGVDYSVECTNNTDSGIAKATITGMGMFSGSIDVPFVIMPADLSEVTEDENGQVVEEATVVTGCVDKTYTGEKQTQDLVVTYNGKTLVENKDYKLIYANNVEAGTAKVMVFGLSNYESSHKTLTFNITKAANPLKATAVKASAKASTLKKKAQTLAANKVVKVSGAEGKVTYKKASGNSKITVASNGKVTLKKGLAKGTYTVKITVTAAGGDNFEKGTQTVSCKITVK